MKRKKMVGIRVIIRRHREKIGKWVVDLKYNDGREGVPTYLEKLRKYGK